MSINRNNQIFHEIQNLENNSRNLFESNSGVENEFAKKVENLENQLNNENNRTNDNTTNYIPCKKEEESGNTAEEFNDIGSSKTNIKKRRKLIGIKKNRTDKEKKTKKKYIRNPNNSKQNKKNSNNIKTLKLDSKSNLKDEIIIEKNSAGGMNIFFSEKIEINSKKGKVSCYPLNIFSIGNLEQLQSYENEENMNEENQIDDEI